MDYTHADDGHCRRRPCHCVAFGEIETLRARIETLCEALTRQTPTFHAVVAGQHLDNCIACVILAELRAALDVPGEDK